MKLTKKKKYIQIALNSDLYNAKNIIQEMPISDNILIEVGTPLIKEYGAEAIINARSFMIEKIYNYYSAESTNYQYQGFAPLIFKTFLVNKKNYNNAENIVMPKDDKIYIVADTKCADLAKKEVEIASEAGANAATCLGVAPIETINEFILSCKKNNIDSMIDMMNVENPILVLKKLKNPPNVIILHRGVDETEKNKEKQIPYYQIKQIKGSYNNVLVAVAGGDTAKEIESAIFNDADIVVLWKAFYGYSENNTKKLVETFLKNFAGK